MNKSKTMKLPPCRVCDASASGFHYGVYTCEACKAFFRRSLTKHIVYECPENRSCDISNKNRNSCALCRYQKCIKMGMCKDAIKTGRYSHEQRACNIREMKKLQSQTLAASDTTKSSNSTTSHSTRADSLSCDGSTDTISSQNSDPNGTTAELVSLDNAILQELDLHNISSDTNEKSQRTDVDYLIGNLAVNEIKRTHKSLYDISRVEYYEQVIQCLSEISAKFACQEELFLRTLSAKESECIELVELKKQIFGTLKPIPSDEYLKFYEETGIDIDGRRELLEGSLLPRMEEGIKQLVVFASAIPGFSELCVEDQIGLIKRARFDVFMIGKHRHFKLEYKIYSHRDDEILHMEDLKKVKGDELVETLLRVQRRIQGIKLVEDETIIIAALCVMCTDDCDIQDRHLVEQSQNFLLECLFYLFDKHHPHEKRRFSRIIDCLTELRTLREENFRCEEQIAHDWWRYINISPLMHSIFTP